MTNMTYVIAGNYKEFINYLKDKQNQVYVADIIRLYGLREFNVVLIGTYYKREDWGKIKFILELSDAKIKYEE
jgi:hypothetical protein